LSASCCLKGLPSLHGMFDYNLNQFLRSNTD